METMALAANLTVMQSIETQITLITKELDTLILLETGAIIRFADVGNYASYWRCVGSAHISNNKKKGKDYTKNSNRFLAWGYMEAANFSIYYGEAAKKFYQREKSKCNATVAIKAVAHKLARACYHMLKTGQVFSVERCFT